MKLTKYTIAFTLTLTLCQPMFGQDGGGGNGGGGNNGGGNNGGGQGNGQNPVVLVPGFDGGGQQSQVDPIARYLMIKDAYRNNTFEVAPPIGASARAQIDNDFYLKYALAAFDLFNAHRKRVVNEQDFVVKSFKDADRANRREQDELSKDQTLAAKRNAFSRVIEAMNALPTPKNVVATGRPLNAYLDRVNEAGSFGTLLSVGSDNTFKLHRPEAIRISAGTGERSVRLPVVGAKLPFHPPAFLSLDAKLRSTLNEYERNRKEATAGPTKGDAIAAAQDALTELDSEVYLRHKGIKVRSIQDENYQDSLAWKKFFTEERRLLTWLAVNPAREAFDGKTIVDLLMYLRRNGYSFAAADPGDEDAYVAMHQQLRDLCVKVAEEPASKSESRLEDFIKQTDRLRERLPKPEAPAAAEQQQAGGLGVLGAAKK
jgi:hypothetical protein